MSNDTIQDVLCQLKNVKQNRKNCYMASCPCHNDSKPSLSIKEIDGKILLHCFAGCEYKDLVKALSLPCSNNKESFNALEYMSEKKNIPISYLESLDIVSSDNKLIIPYRYANQKYARSRTRDCYSNGFYWENEKHKIIPYGIWKKQKDYCVIVEGESDCWTLWYSGFNAIGIPGSTMYKKLLLDHIKQFNIIYIIREEDEAGKIFALTLQKYLKTIGFQNYVYILDLGFKDASEMYLQSENFKEEFSELLNEVKNKKSELEKSMEDNSFPTFIFPSPFKEFIEAGAKSFGCDEAFFAIPMLALLSAIVGNSKTINIAGNWNEKANLYLALIAEPGSMKTPIANCIKKFIIPIMNDLISKNDIEEKRFEHDTIKYKIELDLYKLAIKKGENFIQPEKPNKLTMYDFFVEDITAEALSERLFYNPSGILLFKDELVSLINSFNQYKGGQGNDKQFYLSAWSGSITATARKRTKTTFTEKQYLTLYGAIPPDQLHIFTKQENDGFIDRLLFSYPKPFMKIISMKDIPEYLYTQIQMIISNFYYDNQEEVLTVSKEGTMYFIEWISQLNEKAFFCENRMKGFLNKYGGQALSIALIIAYINNRKEANISDIAHAIMAVEYFEENTKKIFKKSNIFKNEKIIQKIIEYCNKKEMIEITARHIVLAKLNKITKKKDALTLLKLMEKNNIGILKNEIFIFNKKFVNFCELTNFDK